MALTRDEFIDRIGGGVAANTARIDQALAYSLSRIERIRGLEYDPARPIQTAMWDIVSWVTGWPLTLNVLSPVQEVHEVRARDAVVDDDSWALRYDVGLLEIRNWVVWNLKIEMDFTPVDERPLRDSVQADVAAMYWGASQQFAPVSENTRPQFNRDTMEARALRRLELIGMGIRPPSRLIYKENQGGG